jgi:hypothetical protein
MKKGDVGVVGGGAIAFQYPKPRTSECPEYQQPAKGKEPFKI